MIRWSIISDICNVKFVGFVHELRDDAGFGRLWGLMSRCSFAFPYFGPFQYIYSIRDLSLASSFHCD